MSPGLVLTLYTIGCHWCITDTSSLIIFCNPNFEKYLKEFEEAEKEVKDQLTKLMEVKGTMSVDTLHKKLGKIMWEGVGMARNKEGLIKAREEIQKLKEVLWFDLKIIGNGIKVIFEGKGL